MKRFFCETNGDRNFVAFVDDCGKAFLMDEDNLGKEVTLDTAKSADYGNFDGCETAEECAWAIGTSEAESSIYNWNEIVDEFDKVTEFSEADGHKMDRKYELTDDCITTDEGATLHRIKALTDFGDVKAGDLGGYVEKEENLSHLGQAWVANEAKVYDDAYVFGDAQISENAEVNGRACVNSHACVKGNAKVCEEATVSGNAEVSGNARISENAKVYGEAKVYGSAETRGTAQVSDHARVYGKADVCGAAWVMGNAQVYEEARLYSTAEVDGNAKVHGYAQVSTARVCDNVEISGNTRVGGNLPPGQVPLYDGDTKIGIEVKKTKTDYER